jgi:hypothetical protein
MLDSSRLYVTANQLMAHLIAACEFAGTPNPDARHHPSGQIDHPGNAPGEIPPARASIIGASARNNQVTGQQRIKTPTANAVARNVHWL